MATILSLSSEVLRGAIGNSAARFALQRLGHEVWALPTILLSNHPGHAISAGRETPPGAMKEMLEALDRNGWLGTVDAVLTGYMPSARHVVLSAWAIDRVRALNGQARVLVDPALGDDPKGLYIAPGAADAIRATLLPRADITTPNRFELEWLAGGPPVTDRHAARAAAEALGPGIVLATSVPAAEAGELLNLLAAPGGPALTRVKGRPRAPHGTGDLMAALFLAHELKGATGPEALALATAGLEAALDASEGADELALIASQGAWADPDPWPLCPSDG